MTAHKLQTFDNSIICTKLNKTLLKTPTNPSQTIMLITIMTHKSSFLLSSFFYSLSLVIAAHHATSLSSIVLNPSPRQALQENSVFLAEQNTEPPDYRYACLDQSGVAPSSKYQSHLKSLISSLSSDAATSNGFGNRTEGSDEEDMAYGLYVCRGDVNSSLCHSCVEGSSRLIQQHCPNNATAVLWYPFCLLRYSNQYFFGNLTLSPRIPMFDASQNFSSAGEFDSDARILMNGLIQTGSETNLMFGTHVFNINGTQKRYGWVQCSRDITSEECRTCLSNMLEDVVNCCEGKRVWRIFSPSCVVMYETQPFFVNDTALIAPTSQPGTISFLSRHNTTSGLFGGS